MSDSRIPLLSREQALQAAKAAGLPDMMAQLSVFRVLLHHPALTKGIGGLLSMLLFAGKLDGRLRELVIMRIGWATGSVYEWTQHWRIATQMGISEQDLLAVRDWETSHLGAAERAVLAATDDTLARGVISDATWKQCETALPSIEERLELVAAIGNWRLFSQLLRSLKVPLEDGVEPWPPDGVAPSSV